VKALLLEPLRRGVVRRDELVEPWRAPSPRADRRCDEAPSDDRERSHSDRSRRRDRKREACCPARAKATSSERDERRV